MNPYRANANMSAHEDDLSREIRAFLRGRYPFIVRAQVECINPDRCTRSSSARFHIGPCTMRQS